MYRILYGLPALALMLGACAASPRTDGAPARADDSGGPCVGEGELFHRGVARFPTMPSDATITRYVSQRGWEGVCYTTPHSLRAAAARRTG